MVEGFLKNDPRLPVHNGGGLQDPAQESAHEAVGVDLRRFGKAGVLFQPEGGGKGRIEQINYERFTEAYQKVWQALNSLQSREV